MLVATSIAPFDFSTQRQAINTWLKLGIRVISCNVKEEINMLMKEFPDIEFVELNRSGVEIYGKPYPYIYDIFKVLEKSGEDIVGIINSDINLVNFSDGLIEKITYDAKENMIISRRYDVNKVGEKGEYFLPGIDAFFFGKRVFSDFPDEGFMLGRPEWDHWMMYTCSRLNLGIIEIKNEILHHVIHKQRYNPKQANNTILSLEKRISMDKRRYSIKGYYEITNRLMTDLSMQKYYGNVDINYGKVIIKGNVRGLTEDSLRNQTYNNLFFEKDGEDEEGDFILEARQGIYYDKNMILIMLSILNHVSTSAITCNVGLGYSKNENFYKLIQLKDQKAEEFKAYCTLTKANIDNRGKACSINQILAYVDFCESNILDIRERCIVYPAGRSGRVMLDCLETYGYNVMGIADKDLNIKGTPCGNKVIESKDVFSVNENFDKVIIASNLYRKEIYDELKKIIPEKKLILL